MPFWRRRGRIRFYHPPCPAMSVRGRRIAGTLEGKSAGAATRAARPENVSWAQFAHKFPGMTLPGDPASGHAHTCRKPSEIKVKPPMMLSALPTPYELPLCGLSTFRSVAPLLARPIRPAAAHTTPVMRPCDPSSSATQHTLTAAISCFNSMYFAPRPCARCPPREHQFIARLFRMPRPCSFLHLGMLTDTVRARPASKRRIYRPCARPVSRDRGRSRAFCVPSRRLDSAPWRSHRSASRCKPLALGTVAPGPTHLIF